jgi:uracil-DNA glycosylase
MKFNIEQSWQDALRGEVTESILPPILEKLRDEVNEGYQIYPSFDEIFRAMNLTPLKKVAVVILGQDPYHQVGQACGLSFSVKKHMRLPPSLVNIYKELCREYGWRNMPPHGDLTSWAEQGVLLLNASLTVRHNMANSHANFGWQIFTDAVIKTISDKCENTVFLLWGNYARSKKILIDGKKHLILQAPHPSPLSAHRGFFGCGHFSKANDFLIKHQRLPIDWQIL